jgi:hypothetical protein
MPKKQIKSHKSKTVNRKKTNKKIKSPKINIKTTTPKPTILYSKNPVTGEETVATATTMNNQGVHSFAISVEKNMPPSYHIENNGTETFTMSQKRSLVVQSYKDMGEDRVKVKVRTARKHSRK